MLGLREHTAPLLLAVLLGTVVGIGGYTFVYAKGYSYLTDDPGACANCHVMLPQYQSWSRSAHRGVAGCNDCHTPRGFFAKYGVKALNGFNHSLAFTTGAFPDPLQIKPHNRVIAENACRECHADIVAAIDPLGSEDAVEIRRGVAGAPVASRPQIHDGTVASESRETCIRCHTYVGHSVR